MKPRKKRPLAERFWEKVNKGGPVPAHRPDLGPCWIWMASRDPKGYGKFGVGGAGCGWKFAHRVAWLLEHGRWPNTQALHKCDGGPLGCVRPEHLFEGSNSDNRRDSVSKLRHAHCDEHGLHKLTKEQVLLVRIQKARRRLTAACFGVSPIEVLRIQKGERWARLECA